MAGVALKNLTKIDMVIDNATTDNLDEFKEFAKKHLCYEVARVGIEATRTGPCLSVTLVQSDDYPVLSAELKRKLSVVGTRSTRSDDNDHPTPK